MAILKYYFKIMEFPITKNNKYIKYISKNYFLKLQHNLKTLPFTVTAKSFPHENCKYQPPLTIQTHVLLYCMTSPSVLYFFSQLLY